MSLRSPLAPGEWVEQHLIYWLLSGCKENFNKVKNASEIKCLPLLKVYFAQCMEGYDVYMCKHTTRTKSDCNHYTTATEKQPVAFVHTYTLAQPSIFTASIRRIHPLSTPYFLPPFLCSISPPLIALPVSLPSNSLPFMPSTSYHSDSIFISALFSLWSPVPLCLLPAVFVHCSPCTEMALTAETQPSIYL